MIVEKVVYGKLHFNLPSAKSWKENNTRRNITPKEKGLIEEIRSLTLLGFDFVNALWMQGKHILCYDF